METERTTGTFATRNAKKVVTVREAKGVYVRPGHTESVEIKLKDLLSSYSQGIIQGDPNNRGGVGAVRKTVESVRTNFSWVGLGSIHMSYIPGKDKFILVDAHGRMNGLSARFLDGNFTEEDLNTTVNTTLYNEEDRYTAYNILNLQDKHSFLSKLVHPENETGRILRQFLNEVEGIKTLPFKWNEHYFDFLVALQDKLLPGRNDSDDKGDRISPISSLQKARRFTIDLLNNGSREDYAVGAGILKKVGSAVEDYLSFRETVLDLSLVRDESGMAKLSKKGNKKYTIEGEEVANSAGLFVAIVLDQLLQGEPTLDLSTPEKVRRIAKNSVEFGGGSDQRAEKFQTLVDDARALMIKGKSIDGLLAFGRVVTKLNRRTR